jgi:hypothetical protein
MAITINQAPQEFTPIGNPIIYMLSSSNVGNPAFRYVADVKIGSTVVARLKSAPNPTNNKGVFNIREVLREYISVTYSANNTASFYITNMSQAVTVEFREQWSSTVQTTHVDDSFTVIAGAQTTLDFPTYAYTGWVCDGDTNNSKHLLTNRPETTASINNTTFKQGGMLYIPCNLSSSPNIDGIIYQYFFNDELLREYAMYTNNYLAHQVPESNTNGFLAIPFSPYEISVIEGDFTSDALPGNNTTSGKTFEELTEIRVYLCANYDTDIPSMQIYPLTNGLDYYTIKLKEECTRFDFTEIHFQNQLGGVDSYVFTKPNRETVSIQRVQSSKPLNGFLSSDSLYGYTTESYSNFVSNVDYSKTFTVSSDWLTDAEFAWLSELVQSPKVWLYNSTSGFIPIIIQDTQYNKWKRDFDQLHTLTISYKYTFEEATPL